MSFPTPEAQLELVGLSMSLHAYGLLGLDGKVFEASPAEAQEMLENLARILRKSADVADSLRHRIWDAAVEEAYQDFVVLDPTLP
jgi:hypothetical protein